MFIRYGCVRNSVLLFNFEGQEDIWAEMRPVYGDK